MQHDCVQITNTALALLGAQPVSVSRLTTGLTNTAPNGGTSGNVSDGDVSTVVSCTANVSTTNPYVVASVDMGSLKKLAYVDVYNLYLSSSSSQEFYLQHSIDNVVWEQVGDALQITTTVSNRKRFNIAIETRYLRVARVGSTSLAAMPRLGGIDIYPWGTNAKDVHIANIYPVTRNRVLTHNPWRHTLRKVQLSAATVDPVGEWDQAYSLPTWRLGNPRAVFETSTDDVPMLDWEIYGEELFCDLTTAPYVDYQVLANEDGWPDHVKQLMYYALAADLAEPITDMGSKREFWHEVAWGTAAAEGKGGYSRTARNLDAQQKVSERIPPGHDASLVAVR